MLHRTVGSMTRRTALALATAALAAGTFSQASAQGMREHSFKLALQAPKGHPLEIGAQKFADLVGIRSDGKMKVSVFPDDLPGSEAPNVLALQGGTLAFAVLNSASLASQAKDFAVYDLPFMFANAREVDALIDGVFGQSMHARLESKGIVGLAYFELGFRNITNSKRAIQSAQDIEGLKLGLVPNAITSDWIQALGANPAPLARTDIDAALRQKSIDGQESPLLTFFANRYYEVQKQLVITNHQYNPQSLIFSKTLWDGLNAAERKVLQDAAAEAARFQRQYARDAANSTLIGLKMAGVIVTELSPVEQSKLRDRMKPVIDKHGAGFADTVQALQAELSKLR